MNANYFNSLTNEQAIQQLNAMGIKWDPVKKQFDYFLVVHENPYATQERADFLLLETYRRSLVHSKDIIQA